MQYILWVSQDNAYFYISRCGTLLANTTYDAFCQEGRTNNDVRHDNGHWACANPFQLEPALGYVCEQKCKQDAFGPEKNNSQCNYAFPDSKVHGANKGPTRGP